MSPPPSRSLSLSPCFEIFHLCCTSSCCTEILFPHLAAGKMSIFRKHHLTGVAWERKGIYLITPPAVNTALIQCGGVQKVCCPHGALSDMEVLNLLVDFCELSLFFFLSHSSQHIGVTINFKNLPYLKRMAIKTQHSLTVRILQVRLCAVGNINDWEVPATSPQVSSFPFFFGRNTERARLKRELDSPC